MATFPHEKMKDVYTIRPGREGKHGRWVRIGVGFVNHDQSINVKLDATPVNGELHIRDYKPRPWQSESESRQSPMTALSNNTTEEPF